MTQVDQRPPVETEVRESLDGLDGLDGGANVSASDVLDRIWRFFISMRTGLLLILALGLMSLIGTMVVQAPAEVLTDPQAYQSWIASVQPKYGGWTRVIDLLGFFSIFSSILFKGITVLLTTSILACSVNRAPRLWKVAFHPRTRMGETFFTHAALKANVLVPSEPDATMEQVREVLKSNHYRTVIDPEDGGLNLYADRFRWGPFGTVIAHLSFVVILLGMFLSATTGFKNTQFNAPVGSVVQVGNGTGLSIEAKSFSDTYNPDGSAKDYSADLVLYKDGVQVDRKVVQVNHPLTWDGVSFYQSSFGVAAAILVKDAAGKTLYKDSVPLVWGTKDGQHSVGQFKLPVKGMSVYVVGAASGKTDPNIKAGQMQLEISQDGQEQPVATEVVSQGKPATIGGLTYTFERTRQYTGLIVARDPGANIVWVGSTLLVIGIFMVFFFPHRRVWVRIRKTAAGSEILCASTMKRDVAFEPKFHQLVTDIQLASTPSNTSPTSTTQKVGQNDAT
jgi:cytochrome c biogenesis protein